MEVISIPTATIDHYLRRIESQHRQRPRYMAHVAALLEIGSAAFDMALDMPERFNIDTATGAQLDVIGERVGISRQLSSLLQNDDTYRTMIYARIFRNHWDGTTETFQALWDMTVGKMLQAEYHDNGDMSVDILITDRAPVAALELLLTDQLIPRPMGVKHNVYLSRTARADSIGGQMAAVLEAALYNVAHFTVVAG